ncbi:DHHC palmitoyltransferase-domain-containing protein [Globomyces pollinis-pini]|nr:DHHC palmitoyltransferase-domain-containing protein [Globomyces pollinis-pini]
MCNEFAETLVRRYGWIFVGITVQLITFTPLAAQIVLFHPWLSYDTERHYLLLVAPFHLSVLSIWINYILGCRTSPGHVPLDYTPVSGKPRWCKECSCYKPPRSHHCSICNKCVLKMDHHCPWLNNCIGQNNHAYFLRFIGSVTVASLYGSFLIALRIWEIVQYQNDLRAYYRGDWDTPLRFSPPLSGFQIVTMFIVIIIFFLLLLTVGILYVWQLFYLYDNTTTIENSENSTIESLKKRNIIPEDKVFPYDLGWYNNFQQMFGNYWFLWWLPFGSYGNGIDYPKRPGTEHYSWPPREYYLYKKYPYGKPSKQERKEEKRRRKDNHIRRGSEGYLVKQLTAEEREQLVTGKSNEIDDDQSEDASSTDYDSLEESEEFDTDEEVLQETQTRMGKKIK